MRCEVAEGILQIEERCHIENRSFLSWTPGLQVRAPTSGCRGLSTVRCGSGGVFLPLVALCLQSKIPERTCGHGNYFEIQTDIGQVRLDNTAGRNAVGAVDRRRPCAPASAISACRIRIGRLVLALGALPDQSRRHDAVGTPAQAPSMIESTSTACWMAFRTRMSCKLG